MGAAMAGVAYVPLNYRLTREQLDALVARITPPYLIADEHNFPAYEAVPAATVLHRQAFLDAVMAHEPSPASGIRSRARITFYDPE